MGSTPPPGLSTGGGSLTSARYLSTCCRHVAPTPYQPCPHIMSTQTNPHTFAFVRILFSLHNVNYFWYTLYLRYHSFIVSFSKWSMKRSQIYFQIYAFFLFLSLMFFNFSSFSFIFRCFSIIFSSSYLNIARTALVNWEFDVLQFTFYVNIMRYNYLHTK